MTVSLAKRILVRCVDACFAAAVLGCLLSATATPAMAYVDPSVMTYTIQALAGVAVALSAVLGVVWRRLRRVLLRALHIDENANKEVEPDVHRIDGGTPAGASLLASADDAALGSRRRQGQAKPEQLRWTTRLFFAFIATLIPVVTVFVVAPLEIVAASSDSLYFGVGNIWQPIVLFAVALLVVFSLALSALRGRAFNVTIAVVATLGVCAYVQAMFLNTGLPPADGKAVEWDAYTKVTVVSVLVWLAMLAAGVLFSLKKPLAFKGAIGFVSIALVIAQGIGLGTLFTQRTADGSTLGSEKPYTTMQGMMNVSDKSNVIVFILDTYDNKYLDGVLEQWPDALADYTGFTRYRNSSGSMIPTRYALSSLLTGEKLDETDSEYSNSLIRGWYAEKGFVDEVNDLGYSAGIYSNDTPNGMTALSQKTVNIHSMPAFTGNFLDTVGVLGKCALYRDLPWLLKPAFWFNTDDINNAVMPHDSTDLSTRPYLYDDAQYYQDLKAAGLSIDDEGEKGNFRFIHLLGSHYPIVNDEHANKVGEGNTTQLQQSRGALEIVAEYLRQLKELDVYDQSTIVVTADHGEWYLAPDIDGPTSPILLVKPASEDTSNTPCQVSEVPTGHVDLWATLVDQMGGVASAWGGTPVYDVPDEPRTRYYDATSVEGDDHKYTWIKEWKIDGHVLDWDSWEKTGQQWPINSD